MEIVMTGVGMCPFYQSTVELLPCELVDGV